MAFRILNRPVSFWKQFVPFVPKQYPKFNYAGYEEHIVNIMKNNPSEYHETVARILLDIKKYDGVEVLGYMRIHGDDEQTRMLEKFDNYQAAGLIGRSVIASYGLHQFTHWHHQISSSPPLDFILEIGIISTTAVAVNLAISFMLHDHYGFELLAHHMAKIDTIMKRSQSHQTAINELVKKMKN